VLWRAIPLTECNLEYILLRINIHIILQIVHIHPTTAWFCVFLLGGSVVYHDPSPIVDVD
jgi:hypothetical protein